MTDDAQVQRRLVSIMVGDVVGSTSAMEADEESAVLRIAACLDAVSAAVRRREGRVFNTAGDAVLAEFASPVNALRAAMEARAALAEVPGASPDDMRFGLHLADVLALGDDLRGDGVNLAARIQTGAEAGEIEVSEALFAQVSRVSPCQFVDLGPRLFKGVSAPMRIYRVRGAMERHVHDLRKSRAAAAPAVRPNSVVVDPFRVASSADEDQRFLAEGLTEDLILALGRCGGLFVASRTASLGLTDHDPVTVGRSLGVRYVVSGSVRKIRDQLRLNVVLTQSADGHIVWSDRIARPFDEVLDLLDEITARIAATVSGRVEQAEFEALRLKRPESMSAYEYYMRGVEMHRLSGVADRYAAEAVNWFDRAIEADPAFGRPYAMKVCAWSSLPDFDWGEGERIAVRAVELDPSDAEARRILGSIKMKTGDFEAARIQHAKALEFAPNDAYILGRCAAFHIFDGEPEKALAFLDRAEALDPFLPVWVVEERVAALYGLGRYDEMREAARALPFQTRRTWLYRAAARVAEGEHERARHLVRAALAEDPALTAEYILGQENYRAAETLGTLVERVTAAGLPPAGTGEAAA